MLSLRVAIQNNLVLEDYSHAIILELKELDQTWMDALDKIIFQKKKIERAYNKKVRQK